MNNLIDLEISQDSDHYQEELLHLYNRNFILKHTKETWEWRYNKILNNVSSKFFFGLIDKTPVSSLHFTVYKSNLDTERMIGWIDDVCTDKIFRKRGYAESLLKSAIHFGTEKEIDALMLFVEPNNYKAYKMYKKIGFTDYEEYSIIMKTGVKNRLSSRIKDSFKKYRTPLFKELDDQNLDEYTDLVNRISSKKLLTTDFSVEDLSYRRLKSPESLNMKTFYKSDDQQFISLTSMILSLDNGSQIENILFLSDFNIEDESDLEKFKKLIVFHTRIQQNRNPSRVLFFLPSKDMDKINLLKIKGFELADTSKLMIYKINKDINDSVGKNKTISVPSEHIIGFP